MTPAFAEPLPGWVDNLNGPVGIMIGAGKGVIRSMLCNGDYKAEVRQKNSFINFDKFNGIPITVAMRVHISLGHSSRLCDQRSDNHSVRGGEEGGEGARYSSVQPDSFAEEESHLARGHGPRKGSRLRESL